MRRPRSRSANPVHTASDAGHWLAGNSSRPHRARARVRPARDHRPAGCRSRTARIAVSHSRHTRPRPSRLVHPSRRVCRCLTGPVRSASPSAGSPTNVPTTSPSRKRVRGSATRVCATRARPAGPTPAARAPRAHGSRGRVHRGVRRPERCAGCDKHDLAGRDRADLRVAADPQHVPARVPSALGRHRKGSAAGLHRGERSRRCRQNDLFAYSVTSCRCFANRFPHTPVSSRRTTARSAPRNMST
jgi:hypothetical protein